MRLSASDVFASEAQVFLDGEELTNQSGRLFSIQYASEEEGLIKYIETETPLFNKETVAYAKLDAEDKLIWGELRGKVEIRFGNEATRELAEAEQRSTGLADNLQRFICDGCD